MSLRVSGVQNVDDSIVCTQTGPCAKSSYNIWRKNLLTSPLQQCILQGIAYWELQSPHWKHWRWFSLQRFCINTVIDRSTAQVCLFQCEGGFKTIHKNIETWSPLKHNQSLIILFLLWFQGLRILQRDIVLRIRILSILSGDLEYEVKLMLHVI